MGRAVQEIHLLQLTNYTLMQFDLDLLKCTDPNARTHGHSHTIVNLVIVFGSSWSPPPKKMNMTVFNIKPSLRRNKIIPDVGLTAAPCPSGQGLSPSSF